MERTRLDRPNRERYDSVKVYSVRRTNVGVLSGRW